MVGAGWVAPTDFWQMKPWELHWLISSKSDDVPTQNWQEEAYDGLKRRQILDQEKTGLKPVRSLKELKERQAEKVQKAS